MILTEVSFFQRPSQALELSILATLSEDLQLPGCGQPSDLIGRIEVMCLLLRLKEKVRLIARAVKTEEHEARIPKV